MIRRAFLGILFATLGCAGAFAQRDIDIQIEGRGQRLNVPVYRVAITSDDQSLLADAKRAFGLHGSYIVSTPANAQFTFSFTKAGATAVKVAIRGGTLFEQICTGESMTAALMKACDVAVNRTLGKPGFFAGKIVFSYSRNGGKNTDICMSDMVFKHVRMLTNDKSDSLLPHFSPDGRKVMYTGYYRSGFMDLFQIDLAANSRKPFASYKGSNTGGDFSPDGKKVAMILTATGNAEIWTANANGTGFRRLTKTPATESTASFSPDGSKILFAADNRGSPQIYTMPANGGRPSVVRTNISRYCSEPAWNPKDPNKIVFTLAQGRGFQVAVYDFSKRVSEVVSAGESTSTPRWLNDGRHIICAKARGKNRQLYIIDTETKRQAPLHTASFGSAKEPDFVYKPR